MPTASGHSNHAAIAGDQTDLHMAVAEPRIIGRKNHVAGKRHAQAHAVRDAAHLGNHRLLAIQNSNHVFSRVAGCAVDIRNLLVAFGFAADESLRYPRPNKNPSLRR